eukprot:TRINITY_DN5712_c0_g1_i1.p2 TRINITY_DN5712_c0_g1~~TRINITY_DN5712_c0_g1_i1.p2  ORF type:complete len:198 (-),score=30.55 TRINITY_DN5712_c0_g1_i1:1229-1822(-)
MFAVRVSLLIWSTRDEKQLLDRIKELEHQIEMIRQFQREEQQPKIFGPPILVNSLEQAKRALYFKTLFVFGSLNNFNTCNIYNEEQLALLERAIRLSTGLTSLTIAILDNYQDLPLIPVLAEAVKLNSGLKTLSIQSLRNADYASLIADILAHNRSIREFRLHCDIDYRQESTDLSDIMKSIQVSNCLELLELEPFP